MPAAMPPRLQLSACTPLHTPRHTIDVHEAVAHASATNAHAPAAVHSTANQAWGLPTQLCPASPFLLKGYPESHSQWRAQGRVLYGCTTAGALGNSLRVLPTLFLIAIFLDLALVLDDSACANVSLLENGHAVDPVSKHATFRRLLPRSFRGPHFDWSTSAADSAAPLAMDVKAFIGFRAQSANAPTAAKPAYIAGYRYGWPLRVVAHPADMTHRLLKGNLKLRTKVLGLLGPLGRWYVSNASSKWSRKPSALTHGSMAASCDICWLHGHTSCPGWTSWFKRPSRSSWSGSR